MDILSFRQTNHIEVSFADSSDAYLDSDGLMALQHRLTKISCKLYQTITHGTEHMPIVNKIHLLYNSSAALQNLHVQRGALYYTKDSNKYLEFTVWVH